LAPPRRRSSRSVPRHTATGGVVCLLITTVMLTLGKKESESRVMSAPSSSPHIQARRRLPPPVRRLPGPARVLALASVKGGTGKSTAAEQLAVGLALHGFAVLVVEVEYNTRLTHVLTGIRAGGATGDPFDVQSTTWFLLTQPDHAAGLEPIQIDLADLVGRIPVLSKPAADQLCGQRLWRRPATLELIPGSTRLRDLDQRTFLASASTH